MALVTDAEVRTHLRIDEGEDVSVYVVAAVGHAENIIGRSIYETSYELADASDPDGILVDGVIRAAILLIIGDLYRDRENDKQGAYTPSETSTERLLRPYRIGMGV